MLLIADSGSTKTSWRLADENKKIYHFLTDGLNPFFKSQGEIVEEIKSDLIPHFPQDAKVSQIYFYGAGCSSTNKCEMIKEALAQCFPGAKTTINHDILGAARAACANSEGIVCILGTGSNTCMYNGEKIISVIGGLGYILGDEGSGSDLGKNLIEAYLNRELPDELRKEFENTYHLTKEEIDKRVYEKPEANRFLASFSRFIGEHKGHPYFVKLIETCFDNFLDKHVCRYPDYEKKQVHFIGSIAFNYTEFLRISAKKRNITIGKILPYPIEELTLFHLAKEQ
jgi:glucosamine kinase